MKNAEQPVGSYYEFFAGGGMARAGLGSAWKCLFANDVDAKKALSYCRNWGEQSFTLADVGSLSCEDIPGTADLAWASFPCQDLSLAGTGAGLAGARSGTFWPFWRLMQTLGQEGRPPRIIVLENVCGALSSHSGADFHALIDALAKENYRYGAMILDAVHFVPQSRPRLFIVAIKQDLRLPSSLIGTAPGVKWSSPALLKAFEGLPQERKAQWIWWDMPRPASRKSVLADLIDETPAGVRWHTSIETERILGMMSQVHRNKMETARKERRRIVGAIYKRTRRDAKGARDQRAEVRFDDIAGCLRTPAGGSSRQLILVVDGQDVRSRLLSPREAARLMGLSEQYKLPSNYNDAYHLVGDGLVAPVVRHLAESVLEPLLAANRTRSTEEAA